MIVNINNMLREKINQFFIQQKSYLHKNYQQKQYKSNISIVRIYQIQNFVNINNKTQYNPSRPPKIISRIIFSWSIQIQSNSVIINYSIMNYLCLNQIRQCHQHEMLPVQFICTNSRCVEKDIYPICMECLNEHFDHSELLVNFETFEKAIPDYVYEVKRLELEKITVTNEYIKIFQQLRKSLMRFIEEGEDYLHSLQKKQDLSLKHMISCVQKNGVRKQFLALQMGVNKLEDQCLNSLNIIYKQIFQSLRILKENYKNPVKMINEKLLLEVNIEQQNMNSNNGGAVNGAIQKIVEDLNNLPEKLQTLSISLDFDMQICTFIQFWVKLILTKRVNHSIFLVCIYFNYIRRIYKDNYSLLCESLKKFTQLKVLHFSFWDQYFSERDKAEILYARFKNMPYLKQLTIENKAVGGKKTIQKSRLVYLPIERLIIKGRD